MGFCQESQKHKFFHLFGTAEITELRVGGGGKVGAMVYSWLIYTVVWEKPIQHCKATILQLKISKLKKKYKL